MQVSFYLAEVSKKDVSFLSFPSFPTDQPEKSPEKVAIYARITYRGKQMKFYPGFSISPEFWDKDDQRPKITKKYPAAKELKARLDDIATNAERIALEFSNNNGNRMPTPQELRQLLNEAFRPEKQKAKLTFEAFFKEFIQRSEIGTRTQQSGKPVKKGTIRNYNGTLAAFNRYQAQAKHPATFETINMEFYNSFVHYLTKKEKLSTNYIGKHIRVIKTVMREAYEMRDELGIKINDSFTKRGFKAPSEAADTVYLAKWEIEKIAARDLSKNPKLEKVRDLFLIGCYTGLRFSDLKTLRPEQIKSGMMTITQTKTAKPVVIPVHKTVTDILKKYDGKLPKAASNQKTNEYLKDICKEVDALKAMVSVSMTKAGQTKTDTCPKWELISTHTARRSFATNEYLEGTPSITIMGITGHKTEATFLKYIRATNVEHAEKLQSLWAEREKKENKKVVVI